MYHFQITHLEVVLSYLVLLIYEVTLLDLYSGATQFGGVTDWYLDPRGTSGGTAASRIGTTISGLREESSQPPQPPIASTESPQMVSSVKLPILKKGEYILWTMKMEQYLAHTDYALWEVILNGYSVVQMIKDKAGNEIEVLPVIAQQILARTRERKAKSTLLMAILDEHLARFHGIKDAKTLWAAIKTRFNALKLMLPWSIKKNTKCLLLLVKILVMPGKSNAAGYCC
nr:ribonuclease H-like domain-containing protein [Tanacetum cinerariifolium]